MTTTRARELRNNPTDAEKMLWRHLRLRQMDGHKFRRQHSVDQYIVDFVCLEKRLIIEVDGGQHAQQEQYDLRRDAWLKDSGFRIMRLWNNQVMGEINAVKEMIMKALHDAPTLILPRKGGGNRARSVPSPLAGEG